MLLKNPENGIVKFYEFNQIYVKKYSLYYSYTRTKDPFCIQYYGTTVDFSTPPTTLESIACHRARGDARQERRRRCDSLSIFLHPPYILSRKREYRRGRNIARYQSRRSHAGYIIGWCGHKSRWLSICRAR